MIHIVIVDDHLVVREGLRQILELEEDLQIIGVAKDGFECLDLIEGKMEPDVIFMDIKMPGLNGIQTTKQVISKNPHVKIIMLTVYDDQEYVAQAIKAGAKGYVLKNAQRAELVKIVREVAHGKAFIDPSLTRDLFQTIIEGSNHSSGITEFSLTKRELEVLHCIVQGMSDRCISQELNISEHTARTHLKNIYKKLRVSSRSQAAVLAIDKKIIEVN